MKTPEKTMLVKAITESDLHATVVGYYHYDNSTEKHYICSKETLIRHEVNPDTIEYVSPVEVVYLDFKKVEGNAPDPVSDEFAEFICNHKQSMRFTLDEFVSQFNFGYIDEKYGFITIVNL